MLDELNKMYTIKSFYVSSAKSLVQLCRNNPDYTEFALNAKDFVNYLPIARFLELQHIKREPIPLLEEDNMAMAYILAEDELPKWMRADIAKIYRVPWTPEHGVPYALKSRISVENRELFSEGITINIYYNVHAARRRRWGLFL